MVRLSARFFAKILVRIIEDRGAALDPRKIVFLRHADAGDHVGNAGSLVAAELAILQVDVVNDLGNGNEGRVIQPDPL